MCKVLHYGAVAKGLRFDSVCGYYNFMECIGMARALGKWLNVYVPNSALDVYIKGLL